MPRSAMPATMRAAERQMELHALLEQAERIERSVEAHRHRSELLLAEALKEVALAGRLEVLEHQSLTKALHEERIVAGILERAHIDTRIQVSA